MCDRCEKVSRRRLLKISVAGAAAALAACQADPTVSDLPLPYDDHLVAERPGPPVRIDPRTIHVPPPVAPQRSDYGSILPRKAWTSASLTLANGRPMNGVERITIHHSGDGKPFLEDSVRETARHLQIVQRAHLQRGMIDIAYHFAVDRAGRLWQLRWLSYEGQHVRIGKTGVRWNEHNVGICVLGDFNLQSPTVQQRDRLFALVRLVKGKYAVKSANIKMHGELVQTDCPGKHLSPIIRDARQHHLL
jgi:hypothetical protein